MARVLGVDGGGSKTLAALADESGRVVQLGSAAGLDPTAGEDWEARLADLIAPMGAVQAARLGLPFHGELPEVSARQTEVAQRLLGVRAFVVNDVAVAFEGALAGQDGVLILAGTGSMAWARGPLGTTRSGGWGDAFGDEGSGYWIGREALALMSMHLDGRQHAAEFTAGMLERMGIQGSDLIAWTYGHANPRAGMAGLAIHVASLAAGQCQWSQDILRQAARHLAALGQAAGTTCGMAQIERWSYAGGVFSNPYLRKAVTEFMGSTPTAPVLPPVGGAVLAAARAAGWDTSEAFIARLARDLQLKIGRQNVLVGQP